jgi:4-diphosphocytidyl-2-C-methyl-D-erythritol kinase
MEPAAQVDAQAKVNLFLRVNAREQSGYHQIETLFCRLALADSVTVRVRTSGQSLDSEGEDAGPADQNLAFRAARTYAGARGWPRGFAIELTKRIPIGAGLGGGSADAAAVLRALRALDPAPPPIRSLLLWAADLGADVPALTVEAALCLGWGRGERLLVLPPLPPRPVMLYAPRFRVSTADAYAWLDHARTRSARRASGRAIDFGSLSQWEHIVPLMANDFEAVVTGHHPELAAMTDRMRALPGAAGALMSGSGSVVFAIFKERIPHPWPIPVDGGSAFIATSTVDSVVGVRRIE